MFVFHFELDRQSTNLTGSRVTRGLVARTLLGAPGLTTRSKKLLGTKGVATRSQDATCCRPRPNPTAETTVLIAPAQSAMGGALRAACGR